MEQQTKKHIEPNKTNEKFRLSAEIYQSAKRAINTPADAEVSAEDMRNLNLVYKNNKNLVFSIARKYYTKKDYINEEIDNYAIDGLLKAISLYDPEFEIDSKPVLFSTYATTAITRNIVYYLRKPKTQNKPDIISLSEPVTESEHNSHKVLLQDAISDNTYEDYMQSLYEITYDTNRLLQIVNDRQALLLKLISEGKTQKEIAIVFNTNQPYISRLTANTVEKIKAYLSYAEKVKILKDAGYSFSRIAVDLKLSSTAEAKSIYETYNYIAFEGKKPEEINISFFKQKPNKTPAQMQ